MAFQSKLKSLTQFLNSENVILKARPNELDKALNSLRVQGSIIDKEIPTAAEQDDASTQEKISKLVSYIRKGDLKNPDISSLNFVVYHLTREKIHLSWLDRRAIYSTLDSVLADRRYKSTLRHLLYGYLVFFSPKSSLTKNIAHYISRNQENLNKRWHTRVSKFDLLQHQNLIERLGEDTKKALPINFFDQVMTLPHNFDGANVKLLALRSCCELLAPSDQKTEKHNQFLDVYASGDAFQRITASYLLEPIFNWFRNSENQDLELKERVQSVILKIFGDPRMQGGTNSWPPLYLDQNGSKRRFCQEELTRWLTKDTLRLFFKAIKKTADTQGSDSAALRHWPQRQAFWERYLNQGYINQAWVVLGDQVSHQLDSLSSIDGLDVIKYGKFSVADSAAIIMKVGQDATIVEWSHNGAVWVCNNKNPFAPKMFSTGTYRESELRSPRGAREGNPATRGSSISRITHDANHSWRAKLDTAIHDMTGIELRDRYHPAVRTR